MAGFRGGLCLAALSGLLLAAPASAQTLAAGDLLEDYLRVLQITGRAGAGSFTVRPLFQGDFSAAIGVERHPWAGRAERGRPLLDGALRAFLVGPRLRAFANSRYPVGQNDGAVWQGRGLTAALDVGAALEWGALTVEVRPTLLFNQNAEFELAPVGGANPYGYPWRSIDWPQRFGPDAFWTLDPGESEIRLDGWGASVGLSSRSMSWGPAIRNPIILSHNGPGFLHGFLGTDDPLGIGIGTLEGRWIWGRLDDSDWFDPGSPEVDRFITGAVLTYSPSFLTGLSLGVARMFYAWVPEGGVPLGDYFTVFQGLRKKALATPQNPTGDDEHDQLASVFGRWVLADSGFELYWEWARNDHSWELRDFLLEPEHSQGYTLGLRKANDLSDNRILALTAELTHLEREPTYLLHGVNPTYYAHHIVTQGYTQRGQIIGAGIGPGGNAQGIAADLYAPWGKAGVYLQRDVRDNDAYYEWAIANGRDSCCHNVLYHFGAQALWFKGDLDLGAGMIATREMNRYFYGLDLWNLNLSLSAKWHPR